MTNKELFKTLSKENQMSIVKTLACYDKVHVEFYNGEYHITPHWTLLAKYPKDHKILNEFKKSEFDFQGRDYFYEWYIFCEQKENKGEKNKNGAWQAEFEKHWLSIYEKAIEKYKETILYKYGMRLRPYSLGCQPAGVYKRTDSNKYHDLIYYTRELTEKEMETYSLDYLGSEIHEA